MLRELQNPCFLFPIVLPPEEHSVVERAARLEARVAAKEHQRPQWSEQVAQIGLPEVRWRRLVREDQRLWKVGEKYLTGGRARGWKLKQSSTCLQTSHALTRRSSHVRIEKTHA